MLKKALQGCRTAPRTPQELSRRWPGRWRYARAHVRAPLRPDAGPFLHHYYAAPFFKKATTGLKAGSPECKDEALQRATLAALGVPTDDPKAEAGRAVAEICLADLKDQIVDELAEGSSYTVANACPVMLKGKAVTGLMQKRCEAAATAKK